MKKLFLLPLLLLPLLVQAQNLQFHYDFNRSEYSDNATDYGFFTTTLEMFKPDKLGSTFWFVDFDYTSHTTSIQASYWEIAREFTVSKDIPLQLHVEYNGGHFNGGGINHVWLTGINYPFLVGKSAFNTYFAYRHTSGVDEGADFQWTGVWNIPLGGDKFMFSGFIDVWSAGLRKHKETVLLTEPQLWYNWNKTFSLGTEFEISNNFIYGKRDVQVNPTLAVKWNF